MKIAIVNDTVYPYFKGGAPKRAWDIATRLARRGHQVHLFGMKYWAGDNVVVNEGVYLHGVCDVQQLYVGSRRSIKQALYFAYKLLRPLLAENFDIIDCSNFPYFPCFSAKLHSMIKGSTLVVTWHEVWDSYWYEYLGWEGIFGKWTERMVARLTKSPIVVSERTKQGLVSIGGSDKIKVVPNGIDFGEINTASLADDRSDVAFTGRLVENKNVDLLIRSIDLIKQAIPNIRCCIIGDGPERNSLEGLVSNLHLEQNVFFLGLLSHPQAVFSRLKASKVFVLPSTREGFGIVVLEANACGLPVVTVKHPQNAACDLIMDGKNGFLAELSKEDLANKIMMALERTRDMSAHCLEYSKQYDWERMVDMVEDTYQSVLGRRV